MPVPALHQDYTCGVKALDFPSMAVPPFCPELALGPARTAHCGPDEASAEVLPRVSKVLPSAWRKEKRTEPRQNFLLPGAAAAPYLFVPGSPARGVLFRELGQPVLRRLASLSRHLMFLPKGLQSN